MCSSDLLCDRAILLRAGQVTADAPTEEVLMSYQRRDLRESLQRTWPVPVDSRVNGGVYLKAACIQLDETNHGGTLRVDTAFTLRFCVYSTREVVINLSPHYFGPGGDVIFAAASPPSKVYAGDNWFACRMPANFLNDGVYAVQLMIVERGTVLQSVNEALVFEVHEDRKSTRLNSSHT